MDRNKNSALVKILDKHLEALAATEGLPANSIWAAIDKECFHIMRHKHSKTNTYFILFLSFLDCKNTQFFQCQYCTNYVIIFTFYRKVAQKRVDFLKKETKSLTYKANGHLKR